MYPAVAALSNLYGGANGIQNVGRPSFSNFGVGTPQPAFSTPQSAMGYAPPPGPTLLGGGVPQMTPAQQMLYNRYMQLPGVQPQTAPRPPLYAPPNPQTYAAVQTPNPTAAGIGAPPAAGAAQPAQQPMFVNPAQNNFLTTPTVADNSGRAGMNGGVLPYGGGVNGLARYYMR